MPPDLSIALTPVHFVECVEIGSISYPHADRNRLVTVMVRNIEHTSCARNDRER